MASSWAKRAQAVRVAVLRVDRETRKISLGLKQLQASPWDDIEHKYPVTTILNGKVTRLMDFGAFVELELSFSRIRTVASNPSKTGIRQS